MTIEDIKSLIAADESRALELKKSTGELKDGMLSYAVLKETVSKKSQLNKILNVDW